MSETKNTRRRALEILGVGGAAALAAQLPVSRATAATGDPLILGDTNLAGDQTNLRTDFQGASLSVGNDSSDGVGVEAHSKVGVLAFTRDPDGTTVIESAAVRGVGFQGHGVLGQTERDDCAGVRGEAHVCLERGPCEGEADGIGVHGLSEAGPGVRGEAVTGPGVEAASTSGPALRVLGRSQLATAGNGTVPQGQSSVAVAHPGVTATSHICVTLMDDPGPRQLLFVGRDPGVGFTVNLTAGSPNKRPATPFSYLVIEPT